MTFFSIGEYIVPQLASTLARNTDARKTALPGTWSLMKHGVYSCHLVRDFYKNNILPIEDVRISYWTVVFPAITVPGGSSDVASIKWLRLVVYYFRITTRDPFSKRESYNHLNLQYRIITCNISHHLLQRLREATKIRVSTSQNLSMLEGDGWMATPQAALGRWGCWVVLLLWDLKMNPYWRWEIHQMIFFGNVDLDIVKLNNVWMLKMNPFHMYLYIHIYIYLLYSSIYLLSELFVDSRKTLLVLLRDNGQWQFSKQWTCCWIRWRVKQIRQTSS